MTENYPKTSKSYGSEALDQIVEKLKGSADPKKRYEYILWLAKKLPKMPEIDQCKSTKVSGCISNVYVSAELVEGQLQWKGDSDALITKGLLALLIKGLNNLSPSQVMCIDPSFINETGLQASLTPSRANGFMNIFIHMQVQAQKLSIGSTTTTK